MTTIADKIVDQDAMPDGSVAYILTESILYRSTTIKTNSVWNTPLLASAYPELVGLKFNRVKCGNGGSQAYVLGIANVEEDVGNAICFHSSDGGVSWSYTEVTIDVPSSDLPFTMSLEDPFTSSDDSIYAAGGSLNGNGGSVALSGKRINILQQWPSIQSGRWGMTPSIMTSSAKIKIMYTGGDPFLYPATAVPSLEAWYNYTWHANYGSGQAGGGQGNYCVITYVWDPPAEVSSIQFSPGHAFDGTQNRNWHGGYDWEIIEWNGVPIGVAPLAFDVGRHDNMKVYIGSADKIVRSVDGGQHWEDYIIDVGANDIECHYAQASDDDLTIWGSDGKLYRSTGATLGAAYVGVADVVAINVPIRVGSDPVNGFPIWVLEHQGSESYKLRNSVDGAAWTDILTGLTAARSLKTYADSLTDARRIVFLDSLGIWMSIDELTFLNKLGDYGAGSPSVINLF